MISTPQPSAFYLLFLLFSFCFLSFLNEALGVTMSEKTLSFPRRVSPSLPFLSIGRKSIDIQSIYQLQILKNGGMTRNYRERNIKNSSTRRCILISNQFEFFEIMFPQKAERDLFTLTLDIYNPGLNISRRVAPPRFLISGSIVNGLNIVMFFLATAALALPYLAENSQKAGVRHRNPYLLIESSSNELEADKFMLYAASYDWGTNKRNKVKKILDQLQKCSGIALQITTNLDYKFLTPPTKRWSITAGPYSKDQALALREKLISCGASDSEIKEEENDE